MTARHPVLKKSLGATELAFYRRRQSLLAQLKGHAALFCSAPQITKSRDQHFEYHQDRDFLYLTGCKEADSALLLLGNNKGPRSVLFLRDRDPKQEVWLGERIGLRRAKNRFRVDEVRDWNTFESSLPALLKQSSNLHYTLGKHKKIDEFIVRYLSSALGPRIEVPRTLTDARVLTSKMRFVKDRDEIRALQHAAEISARAFLEFFGLLRSIKSERHAAKQLEALFARFGADGLAFSTIVASGKNSTTLHHTPTLSPIWQRELVLIDAGASFQGYSADITRTVPASRRFSNVQAEVYDVVHGALERAKEKCKPHATLDEIHDAAVKALTAGLLKLKILKGNVQQLVSEKAYSKYFMHRTSHWLGLDTHDCSPITIDDYVIPSSAHPVEPGVCFVLEPGLYFRPDDESVPKKYRGIGIRVEDDILITKDGHEVLTRMLPTEREEIERLLT